MATPETMLYFGGSPSFNEAAVPWWQTGIRPEQLTIDDIVAAQQAGIDIRPWLSTIGAQQVTPAAGVDTARLPGETDFEYNQRVTRQQGAFDASPYRLSHVQGMGGSNSELMTTIDPQTGQIISANPTDPGSGFWNTPAGMFLLTAGAGAAASYAGAGSAAAPTTTTAAAGAPGGAGGAAALPAGTTGAIPSATTAGSNAMATTTGVGTGVGGGGGLLGTLGSAGQWMANNPELAGALIGAGLGAYGSSQDQVNTVTSTTTNGVAPEYRPQFDAGLASILNYGNSAAPAYTGPSGIGFNSYLGDAASAFQGLGASANAEMGAVRDMISRGTAGYSSAANAEMDEVRRLIALAGAGYNAHFNPYSDATNPYIDAAIDRTNRAYIDNFNNLVAPKFSMGSSFGNSGLGFAEALERSNIGRQLADNAAGINYDAYNLAAQLSEAYADRSDLAKRSRMDAQLTGSNILGNLGEAAAGRLDAAEQFRLSSLLQGGGILGNLGESAAGRADAQARARASGLLGLGQTQVGIDQFNTNFGWNQYTTGLDEAYRRQQALQSGLGMMPTTQTTTQTSTVPGNAASGLVGGAVIGSQVGNSTRSRKSGTASSPFYSGDIFGSRGGDY